MCGICFICKFRFTSAHNQNHHLHRSQAGDHVKSADHLIGKGPDNISEIEVEQDAWLENKLLLHRGPDASSCHEISLPGNLHALMQGCVLHLRGTLTPQPLVSPKGNTLLWNGEVFDGLKVKEEENDTQVLHNTLESCANQESVLQTLQQIQGPWAFIYWQAELKTLWFGRDMFGRRSLLWHFPEDASDEFVLTSVALGQKAYKELPSVGIFSMDFSRRDKDGADLDLHYSKALPDLVLYPWKDCRWPGTSQLVLETPDEDLIGYLYPKTEKTSANVTVRVDKNCRLKRWIPTMNVDPSLSYQVQLSNSHLQDTAAALDTPTMSLAREHSAPEVEGNTTEQAGLDLGANLEQLLRQIFEEREDLHLLIDQCIKTLEAAVDTRVKKLTHLKDLSRYTKQSSLESSARVAVLFSGGLDSTLLAALADRCLPPDEPIDLLNVAFEQAPPPVQKQRRGKQKKPQQRESKKANQINSSLPTGQLSDLSVTTLSDKLQNHQSVPEISSHSATASEGSHELTGQMGGLSSPQADVSSYGSDQSGLIQPEHLLYGNTKPSQNDSEIKQPSSTSPSFTLLSAQNPAVSINSSTYDTNTYITSFNTPECPQNTTVPNLSDYDTKMYFSTDSKPDSREFPKDSKVPNLSDCNTNKIPSRPDDPDNPENTPTTYKPLTEEQTTFDPYNVPDRQTGRTALSELNPHRQWNFVEINVTREELQAVRQSRISRLIYPLRTVLDDSIGCAVWFAARGRGVLGHRREDKQQEQMKPFTSRAQVLLCGMAADELFAGYSRHRVTFNSRGWPGLEREIEGEIWRISARNLGRDDRIIGDHGKEARFPYLDEGFVKLVSEISLQRRVDFRYPRGIGEKLLLRLCALKLGLAKTACQAKRAIQFGSKIAKLDKKKEKGSDVCDRLS